MKSDHSPAHWQGNKMYKMFITSLLVTVMASYGAVLPSSAAADDNIGYITSTSSPKIFVEQSMDDGESGTYDIGLVRSFFDPNSSAPTNYTTLVDPGDQYAMDSIKVKDSGTWYRLMSDSNNTSTGSADGYEDGVGNASSLYDNGMSIIALTAAGETAKAEKIIKGFVAGSIYTLMDDDSTGEAHPDGTAQNPIKDQAVRVTANPAFQHGMCFDVWKEASTTNDEYFQDDEDERLAGYPRLAPGHEYGIIVNDPENPTWAGIDFDLDVPRVAEIDDISDADEEGTEELYPYLEDEFYHRSLYAYSLFYQWYDADAKYSAGTEDAERMSPDKLIPYSSRWDNEEYTYKDYTVGVGDNLWLVIGVLYYSSKTDTSTYLPVAYNILDTIVDNLQDFNGGVHFGYYGSHEVTSTSTEHCLDFAFAYHWIEKLYNDGLVDSTHYNRYKDAYDGTLTLTSNDVVILDINTGTYSTSDDKAVSGADYMLKHLAIPHTTQTCAYDASSLSLPTGCDVLILPETPFQYLGSALKAAINDFAEEGGKIFATGASAVDIGSTNNPFGVEFDDMQTVGGTTGDLEPIAYGGRNIVISKVYKDGHDNASTAVDINQNGIYDASEADNEPTEKDNWEEGLGNLHFAYTPPDPYDYILLWSFPDYKKSRLTYFLQDIGDNDHALNGGNTPNLADGDSRTSNEGNAITVKQYAKTPTIYSANEWGHLPMLIAKIDLEGRDSYSTDYSYDDGEIETLYFNEPSDGTDTGKVIYFVGDMFTFFYDCINHNTVDGVKFSPYNTSYFPSFQTHAQVLENALTWFYTDGLDPVYAVRDPYGTTTVYSENQAGEMGYYSSTYNKLGSDSTNPGKSITSVDMDYADNYDDAGNLGSKCMKIVKDSSETNGGIWLTRGIEWPDASPMDAGFLNGSYLGAKLPGATSLTFWAKANASTNVTFGFGIDNGDIGDPGTTSDSDTDSTSVTLGTTWTQYTIDTTAENLSWINGLFYAKVTSSTGTIYVDHIHYNPRTYGYNDEAVEGKRSIYVEGNTNEGIWSGWYGSDTSDPGKSLTLEQKDTTDPKNGFYSAKITKDSSESYAGIWVQQLGYDKSEDIRWSTGEGKGANLTGATKLTFWAKSDSATGYEVDFGYGYDKDAPEVDDSSFVSIETDGTTYPKVDTTWRQYEIDLTSNDMSHVNGLFFITLDEEATIYLDDIRYEPVGNGLVPTYAQDVEAGNHNENLWREKDLAHLGIKHFLENAVWADSADYLRLPPGVYEDSDFDNGYVDDYNNPLPDDIAYEMDHIITTQWPAPSSWARKKFFIRGQLDYQKASDMCTWGAAYWLDKSDSGTADKANAEALVLVAEDIFMTTVTSSGGGVGDTNLAPDGTATASSYQAASVTPDKAIDENTGTRWTSQYSDPQWIRVDLGSAATIIEIDLNWENSAVFDDEYKIQSSTNDSTWTDEYHETAGSGQVHVIEIDEVEARYWRMYGISRNAGWGHSLWEFEIYEGQ